MRTGNPALSENAFRNATFSETQTQTMTLDGTVIKTAVLLGILVSAAGFTWSQTIKWSEAATGTPPYGFIIAGGIGGFILAMITIFKPNVSPYTAPLYAVFEGLAVGGISAVFEIRYPGIVVPSVGLTFGTLAAMLLAYRTGLVKATENFKMGVIAATGGIAIVYVVTMLLSMFGVNVPYIHRGSPIGIGISLFVVVIAALNLVLDFDTIETGVKQSAPKYMEWYGGFSLLLTLVWLYLEILRLLANTRGRD